MLPGSQQEEDEGTVTTTEGRIVKINRAVASPGDARQDWRIIQDIARALGRPHGFEFGGPREIFDELRRASAGGVADYAGVTWERIEREQGVFWPCPAEDHPGTPRLFEPGSWNPVARGRRTVLLPRRKGAIPRSPPTRLPTEDTDTDYPLILTTGRVVSQFLSGTQTRRIGPLLDHYPVPRVEMHPTLAQPLGIADGDRVTVETRRGVLTAPALVVGTIRPDTLFVPYHWPGAQSVNRLTIAAQDPISKIPEYKACAARLAARRRRRAAEA